jgi:hypothetical protein
VTGATSGGTAAFGDHTRNLLIERALHERVSGFKLNFVAVTIWVNVSNFGHWL